MIRKLGLTRTRMRRRTRKGDNPALRIAYREEHLSCGCCWATWRDFGTWLELHHILGGRWGRKDHHANFIMLCNPCHRVLQGGRREESIVLKLKAEIGEYDRAALVELHANNRERVPQMARKLPWWIQARREARR